MAKNNPTDPLFAKLQMAKPIVQRTDASNKDQESDEKVVKETKAPEKEEFESLKEEPVPGREELEKVKAEVPIKENKEPQNKEEEKPKKRKEKNENANSKQSEKKTRTIVTDAHKRKDYRKIRISVDLPEKVYIELKKLAPGSKGDYAIKAIIEKIEAENPKTKGTEWFKD